VEQQNSNLSHPEGLCCFAVRKRVLSDAEPSRDEYQELGNLSSEGSASLGPHTRNRENRDCPFTVQ
jgi:hypothetical protein